MVGMRNSGRDRGRRGGRRGGGGVVAVTMVTIDNDGVAVTMDDLGLR